MTPRFPDTGQFAFDEQAVATAYSKPARSCLFVPAYDPRKLSRAFGVEADQIVVDLQDGVPPDAKREARQMAIKAIETQEFQGRIGVRINEIGSPWCHEDVVELVEAVAGRLDVLMVPNIEVPSHLHFVDHLLSGVEAGYRLGRIGVELLVETARAVVNVRDLALASDRIEALAFGPGDYAADMGFPQADIGISKSGPKNYPWDWAMSMISNNARAIKARAIDGPYSIIHDRDGFKSSAETSRLLGYEGKLCIHPEQVAWANEIFTPTDEELKQAREVLQGYRRAVEAGDGVATVNGAMVDEASRKMAERTVRRWESSNASGGVE